jgi:hypothetical protein
MIIKAFKYQSLTRTALKYELTHPIVQLEELRQRYYVYSTYGYQLTFLNLAFFNMPVCSVLSSFYSARTII